MWKPHRNIYFYFNANIQNRAWVPPYGITSIQKTPVYWKRWHINGLCFTDLFEGSVLMSYCEGKGTFFRSIYKSAAGLPPGFSTKMEITSRTTSRYQRSAIERFLTPNSPNAKIIHTYYWNHLDSIYGTANKTEALWDAALVNIQLSNTSGEQFWNIWVNAWEGNCRY